MTNFYNLSRLIFNSDPKNGLVAHQKFKRILKFKNYYSNHFCSFYFVHCYTFECVLGGNLFFDPDVSCPNIEVIMGRANLRHFSFENSRARYRCYGEGNKT